MGRDGMGIVSRMDVYIGGNRDEKIWMDEVYKM